MKSTVFSLVLVLTSHNAGAFVGHLGSVNVNNLRTHHDDARRSPASHSNVGVRAAAISRVARRRHLHRTPCAMSAVGGDSAAEAGDKDGEEESTAIPPAASASESNAVAADDAAGAEPASSSADGNTAGGVQSDRDTGDGAAKADGKQHQQKDAAAEEEEEEEEGSGETVYLPTGDNKDFRLFRAKLRAGSDEKWQEQLKRNVNAAQLGGQDAWAHELSAPEKGCLIVAKTNEFSMAQTYFNEAVIFLATHDEMGSAGFILNRPTTVQLGDLVEGDALPHFRQTPLYLGGDVGEGNVQILHPYGPDKLSESMEIIPGVYIGGAVDEADHMVATGKAKVDDFKFMLHLCGWGPGQLQAEIDQGVWFAVASSPNIVMKHCLGLPVPLWREVMTLMGPKYGLLARDSYDDL